MLCHFENAPISECCFPTSRLKFVTRIMFEENAKKQLSALFFSCKVAEK